MKSLEQINEEIEALDRLAKQCPDDARAQASIEGQIDVLLWATGFKAEAPSGR